MWADLPQNTLSFLSIQLNYPDLFVGHFITFLKCFLSIYYVLDPVKMQRYTHKLMKSPQTFYYQE